MFVKVYIVRGQTGQYDEAYGAPRTLGDPFMDKEKAEERAQRFREARTFGHAFIETHWLEVTDIEDRSS